MASLLLVVIYLAFISLGLPDSLLGSAWPVMHPQMSVPVSFAGFVGMVSFVGTVISSLFSDKLLRKFGAGKTTAVSVALTAIALFGYSVSTEYWMLLLWAVPYGISPPPSAEAYTRTAPIAPASWRRPYAHET